MRLRHVMAAVVTALFVAGFPASAAGGDGGHPVVVYNAGAQDDSPGIPSGANNWNCKPSQEHPNPVVLVHGLGGAAGTNWGYIAPQLAAQGYCVFALTYGKPPGFPPISGGFAPMENSAPELADFVDRVLAATGAPKVDLVGHSEGTVMPQYYLKFLGGAPKVQRYVALTPLYDGTTLNNSSEILNRLATEVPVLGTLPDQACGSCREFFKDSDFMHKLNAGGAAVTNALALDRRRRERGLDSAYELVLEPPQDYTKLRLHKSPGYQFEPRAGHQRPAI